MPLPHKIYASENSFTRYRPAFTALHVFDLKDDGRRIEINDDGHIIVFDLSSDQAGSLADLLKASTDGRNAA
jgi:hypothetical protein